MPWPTPMHIVAAPLLPGAERAELVDERRGDAGPGAAERVAEGDGAAAAGWSVPGRGRARRSTASDWAANASLSSTTSSVVELPAGPVERQTHRRRRADAHPPRLDAGRRPRDDAGERLRDRDARSRARWRSSTAAAPSLSGLELPAVTVPSAANTGRSAASRSRLVSARGPSSTTTSRSPSTDGDQLAVERSSRLRRRPPAGGCRRRSGPVPRGRSSTRRRAPRPSCPRLIVCSVGHPRVDQAPAEGRVDELLRPRQAVVARGSTNGARLIASTPPATATSPRPRARSAAARLRASRPDPHSRLTVAPGIDSGRPASSTAIRATLRLSSPAWLAAPHTTSEISAGSRSGLRASRAASTVAARSSGRTPLSAPRWRPIGVRQQSTTKTSWRSPIRSHSLVFT